MDSQDHSGRRQANTSTFLATGRRLRPESRNAQDPPRDNRLHSQESRSSRIGSESHRMGMVERQVVCRRNARPSRNGQDAANDPRVSNHTRGKPRAKQKKGATPRTKRRGVARSERSDGRGRTQQGRRSQSSVSPQPTPTRHAHRFAALHSGRATRFARSPVLLRADLHQSAASSRTATQFSARR